MFDKGLSWSKQIQNALRQSDRTFKSSNFSTIKGYQQTERCAFKAIVRSQLTNAVPILSCEVPSTIWMIRTNLYAKRIFAWPRILEADLSQIVGVDISCSTDLGFRIHFCFKIRHISESVALIFHAGQMVCRRVGRCREEINDLVGIFRGRI